MGKSVSRREFLEIAAVSLGAATLTQSGLIPLASADEGVAVAQCRITLPKDSTVKTKILIAYASRCGSTIEVAQSVSEDLRSRGLTVDVMPADKVNLVSGYEAVIVASAVRFGKWLPQAVKFARSYQSDLKQIPVAYMSVHLMNTGTDEKSRAAREAYTNEARSIVQPCAEVFFAGKMDLSKLSFSERLLGKIMKAKNVDQRDWPAIHKWGSNVFAA